MGLDNLDGELSDLGRYGGNYEAPTIEGGPISSDGDSGGPYDLGGFILPKQTRDYIYGMPGGRPGRLPANPPSFGNDMGTPQTQPAPVTTPSAAGAFDLSSLLSGNIMGIPTWIILAAAAYFLFFKKGR